MGEQRLAGFVQRKVDDAIKLGLCAELDVARFVTLAFALRRGHFDREPWAQAVLSEPDVPARIRVNRLWTLARERLAVGPQERSNGP